MKYKKTELGKQTFKDHNNKLSMPQRTALIMFDGEKDDSVILAALAVTGFNAEDIKQLVEAGLLEPANAANAASAVAPAPGMASAAAAPGGAGADSATAAVSEQERYQNAYPIATKLTSGLGLRGFRLNMAVESASGYKELLAVAPKIREAVGDEKFAELARALKGR